MGCCNASAATLLKDATRRVQTTAGPVQALGRYHSLPARFEDDYELSGRVLGHGVSGEVHAARCRSSGITVAVKTLALSGLSRLKKQRLVKEVEVFLSVDHPHVVRLLDVYESEVSLTLVMEHLSGGELFHRQQEEKRFSEASAAEMLKQVLLAVRYLHGLNVVHRDLKMHNFLFKAKDSLHLSLIDFGFSKFFKPAVAMRSAVGTLGYMAPEILAETDMGYTSKCDMWSVGIIAFNLLAGYMPFWGSAREQLQMMVRTDPMKNGPCDRWGSVSAEAQDFVRSLLACSAKSRPSAAVALQHPWLTSLTEAPSSPEKGYVFESCVSFANASRFRRACMQMLAWSLTEEEDVESLRQVFQSIDKSNTGVITLSDFRAALLDRFDASSYQLEEVFKTMGPNHDDAVYYSEFLAAMVAVRKDLQANLAKEVFRRLDRDHKGFISGEDCQAVVGVDPSCATPKSLKRVQIYFEDFEKYILRSPEDTDKSCAHCSSR